MAVALARSHLPVDYNTWISDVSFRRCWTYLWMASIFSFSTSASAVCSTVALAQDFIIRSTTSAILNWGGPRGGRKKPLSSVASCAGYLSL